MHANSPQKWLEEEEIKKEMVRDNEEKIDD